MKAKLKRTKKILIEQQEEIALDIKLYSKKGVFTKSGEPVRIDWLKKTNQRISNLITTLTVLEEYYAKEKL